jgi:hypothetical protein
VNGHDAVLAVKLSVSFAILLKIVEFGLPGTLPSALLPFANQGALVWLVAVLSVSISAWMTHPPPAEKTTTGLIVRLNKSDFPDSPDSPGDTSWLRSVTFWWLICVLVMFLLIVLFSIIL